jgi:hypothetical protein
MTDVEQPLTKEVILEILDAYEYSQSQLQFEAADNALKQMLRTSVAPCVFNIGQLAGKTMEDMCDTGIERCLLKALDSVAKTRCAPPYSKDFLYTQTLSDWLCTCIASDAY